MITSPEKEKKLCYSLLACPSPSRAYHPDHRARTDHARHIDPNQTTTRSAPVRLSAARPHNPLASRGRPSSAPASNPHPTPPFFLDDMPQSMTPTPTPIQHRRLRALAAPSAALAALSQHRRLLWLPLTKTFLFTTRARSWSGRLKVSFRAVWDAAKIAGPAYSSWQH